MFKHHFISIVLCLAFFATPLIGFAESPVKFLTFNVWNNAGRGGEDDWYKRKEGVVALMLKEAPDFIGAQEVFLDKDRAPNRTTAYFENNLTGYKMCARNVPKDWEPCALNPIYYLKKRWEVDSNEQGTFWLSPTPETVGSNGWGNTESRIVNWAHFHELGENGKRTGKDLYVYNTHFDHQHEVSRQKSAILLLNRIAERKKKDSPVFIMGDFNCGEESAAINYIKGKPMIVDGKEEKPPITFVDTFRVNHPDEADCGTFHNYSDKRENIKIDYIFALPSCEAKESRIIRDKLSSGRFPTDHFPVSATTNFY